MSNLSALNLTLFTSSPTYQLQKNINNSMSTTIQPYIGNKWMSKYDIKIYKPNPNKYKKHNISYIKWELSQPLTSLFHNITLFSSYKQYIIIYNAIKTINNKLCKWTKRKTMIKTKLIKFVKNTDFTNKCKCSYCYIYNILKNFKYRNIDIFWLDTIIPQNIIILDSAHKINLF